MDAKTEKNYRPSFYLSLTFGLLITAISLIVYLIFPTTEPTQTIEANDEGEALDKARNLAEEADMNDFVVVEELESQIISTH
jgi:hypothetical protein